VAFGLSALGRRVRPRPGRDIDRDAADRGRAATAPTTARPVLEAPDGARLRPVLGGRQQHVNLREQSTDDDVPLRGRSWFRAGRLP
jgi:hypothetical protein